MKYLPLFFDLTQQPCLVVGGGNVAVRKVALLVQAGACVTVLSSEVNQALAAQSATLTIIQKKFSAEDIQGYRLVISATNQAEINSQVASAARQHQIPVNVVDNPDLCDFIFPSIIDRSPMLVAVSSSGVSPLLTRLLRTRLEGLIPVAYGQLARLAESFRATVKQALPDITRRRIFWEKILHGAVAEQVFSGHEKSAQKMLQSALEAEVQQMINPGEVYLVGAGPGDPDLLTFRALRLMQQADVVVYDRLVAPQILELVRRDAERIYAGKQRSDHSMPQEQINHLLVRLAHSGKRVVRLKGGDPFIFGRGGEELESLMDAGVRFQVVPGITAASGCASYAGIPLTHRDYAQSCIFVTGHGKNGEPDLDWQQLAVENQTLVFYMSLLGLKHICKSLLLNGSATDLPAALIQQGTTQNQRILLGTLSTLPSVVSAAEDVKPPTLLIVGRVVNLHKKLSWFGLPALREG